MATPIIYAVYRGDKFIDLGTAYQLAHKLNVSPETIKFYTTPTYKKRMKNSYEKRIIVIKIEDD